MLSSENIPYVKFGVFLLRKFLCEYHENKDIALEKKEIYDELIIIFLNDKIVDFEIKVIVINYISLIYLTFTLFS